MPFLMEKRLAALRALLAEQGLDAVIVTKYVNLHYFSGFRGDDTTLIISADRTLLVTDSRYTEQAKSQAVGFGVVEQKDGLLAKTAELIKELGCKKVGFEGNDLVYDRYARLRDLMEGVDFSRPLKLDALREVKDTAEIACIRKACEIADGAFERALKFIRPGVSELAVAACLENAMRELGSEGPSFKTIVASGLRGAMPHGVASEKLIAEGEFVTMDFGAMYQGYCSDMTRTICVGRADERQRRIYGAVLEAQKLALSLIGPGVSGRSVDRAARESLERQGLAQYFGHGLGHSLGLEIHEEPRLSRRSDCEHLQPGMLVTDEPGVYISDWGGLRIEDTVLVTETGAEALTGSGKELIEL